MVVDMNDFANTLHPVWAKIPAISQAFIMYPDVEWVWWLDVDAIIMTSHVDLYENLLDPTVLQRLLRDGHLIKTNEKIPLRTKEPIIMTKVISRSEYINMENIDSSKIDIICVEDKDGLNAGSFFIRNTEAMRLFVDLWSDPILVDFADKNFMHKEQDLLLHLILEHPILRERVGFVPQRVINAYQDMDDEEVRWHPGDIVVHFPNCV